MNVLAVSGPNETSGLRANRALAVCRTLGCFALLAVLWFDGAEARAGGAVTNCTEQAFRAALAGGGVVTFTNDCTIALSQRISITGTPTTITAVGRNVTISGGGSVPLFTVSGTLTLINLTLANGKSPTAGGALSVNLGASVLASNCVFAGNSVTASNGVAGAAGSNSSGSSGGDGGNGTGGISASGGAIWNGGTLTLAACTLSNNTATAGNGGAGGSGGNGTGGLSQGGNGGVGGPGGASYGGAVYNEGSLTLTDCTIAGNTAAAGDGAAGGVAGSGAFPGRAGQGGAGSLSFGGGIYSAQIIAINRCTFSANSSTGGDSAAGGTQSSGLGNDGISGGNAFGGGLCSSGISTATNSTFYGNSATGGKGGNGGPGTGTLSRGGRGGDGGNGIGGGLQSSGTLTIDFCTFANCAALGGTNGVAGSGTFSNSDGQPGRPLGGDIANTAGSSTLMNSLIVSPQTGTCGYGTFSDGGYNMTTDNSIALGATSFPNTANPMLGSFGQNGGLTATLSLLTASPAIDQIPSNLTLATDQRGVPRPLNGEADIGAYEAEATAAPVIVTDLADQTVWQGAPATFAISAYGASTLRYQWYLAGSAIANATSSSYTVPSAWATNLGPYQVIITNSFGSATSAVAYVNFDMFTVSGSVYEGTNGLAGVTITAYGGQQTVSGPSGGYSFALPAGTNILTPSLTNYSFVPAGLTLGVLSNVTTNFQAFPRIGLSVGTDDQVHIYGGGIAGLTYVIETSADLIKWVPLSTNVAPIQFSESVSTQVPAKFYRLRR